jgi:hypothetical protein
MRSLLLLGAAMVCCCAQLHASETPSGKEVYHQLDKLLGTWTGHTSEGRAYTVSFRHTAGDSVLLETWTLASGRESMTLYALDDERLIATHYCPQGNQPRLEYSGTDAAGRWQFRFVDGSNLHVKGRSHQQAFWLKLDGDGSFERGETYVDNDAPPSAIEEGEAVRYTRTP